MKFLFFVQDRTNILTPADAANSPGWTSMGIFPHTVAASMVERAEWFCNTHLPEHIHSGWLWIIPVPGPNLARMMSTSAATDRRTVEILASGAFICQFNRRGFIIEPMRHA